MTHTIDELHQMQSLSLQSKVSMTRDRIRAWIREYGEDGVYCSFSGGKDSTVLLDIIRNDMGEKDIPAVFVDVPTQFPELRDFAQTYDNTIIIRPRLSFMQVCDKYGFPLISKEVSECVSGAKKYLTSVQAEIESLQTDRQTDSCRMHNSTVKYVDLASIAECEELGNLMERDRGKRNGSCRRTAILLGMFTKSCHFKAKENIPETDRSMFSLDRYKFLLNAKFDVSNKCCNVMKKEPLHTYARQTGRRPITAQMADESRLRMQKWLQNGCNGFNMKEPISNPMSFWTEQDVLEYVKTHNLPICSVYGEVVEDFNAIGHVEGQMSLLEPLKPPLKTTGCQRTGCMLCGFGCHLEKPGEGRFEMLKETHPKMYGLLDVVKNNGVTFREAIDWVNENGDLHIRY